VILHFGASQTLSSYYALVSIYSVSILFWLILLLVYEESLMLRRIWVRVKCVRPILLNPCIS
jgi:hypothetical protein